MSRHWRRLNDALKYVVPWRLAGHALQAAGTRTLLMSATAQAHADRLEILLRDERKARIRAEEELDQLRALPPPEPAKKAKGKVNFIARPWLFRYKTQRAEELEAIEEEEAVGNQPSIGGDSHSRQGAAGGSPAGAAAGSLVSDGTASRAGDGAAGTSGEWGMQAKEARLRSGSRPCAFTRGWCVLTVMAAIIFVATIIMVVPYQPVASQVLRANLWSVGAVGGVGEQSFDLQARPLSLLLITWLHSPQA